MIKGIISGFASLNQDATGVEESILLRGGDTHYELVRNGQKVELMGSMEEGRVAVEAAARQYKRPHRITGIAAHNTGRVTITHVAPYRFKFDEDDDHVSDADDDSLPEC